MSVLAVEGLTKSHGRRPALSGVSLTVDRGEIVALLGPTGAGKTTTLGCIAGLVAPDGGRILMNGRDVTRADPRERDVTMVFEGFNLLPLLSAYDNIAFPLRSPVFRQPAAEVDRRVRKAAADLRIGHLLGRGVDQLSGGERQRVAVARALVREPRLYLLDEPLSALDLKLREALQEELRGLQRDRQASILYATHDFHGAAAVADRIALIAGGRILQAAPLERLIADPAHVGVGRLIGSPAMALFAARAEGGTVALAGGGPRLAPAAARGAAGAVTLGLWPDDIVLAAAPADGLTEGEVYATDFRGMDRAVQVRFGPHAFRKVVPLALDLAQGARCWFALPAAAAFLFDGTTGLRLGTGEQE
ncbi:MAG: ABC transporter ATP-binding protein [Rhodobacteraceae bacterium]|nr:ABC transporter ATP-binding protein [Paracoccaceae bacterium]